LKKWRKRKKKSKGLVFHMGKKKKKRYRGHYCFICGRIRRNEKFSGKGHNQHICKDCWPKRKEHSKKESVGVYPNGFTIQKPKQSKRHVRKVGRWITKRRGKLIHYCEKCNQGIEAGQLVFYYHQDLGRKSKRWYECTDCASDITFRIPKNLRIKHNFEPKLTEKSLPGKLRNAGFILKKERKRA
jgi:hypothetical protein